MWVLALGWLIVGCADDLGACDAELARELVYDSEGVPAYAGQALVHASCGQGGFCHSVEARGARRWGAPAELDFDMAVASVTSASSPAPTRRLELGRGNVIEWARDIYAAVESGVMPPFGRATLEAHAAAPRYRRIAVDGTETRLGAVDSAEGIEVLRNWLACGAPVVERTEPAASRNRVGDTVALGAAEPPLPTFESLFSRVIFPRCGASCHGPTLPFVLEETALDLSQIDGAYAGLIDRAAGGSGCGPGGPTIAVPGDPEGSLLIAKLRGDPDVCGAPMPLGETPLAPATVAAFAEWIRDGALR